MNEASEDRPEAGAEGAPDQPHRERTTMDDDLPPTDDVLLEHEEQAAADEAAHIGGPPHPAGTDEAARPLEEAGEGVAEGYEESERELAEQATHGEDRWVPEPFPTEGGEDRLPADAGDREPQELVPEAGPDRVQPSYSDPDAIAPTELRIDLREDAPDPDESPLVAPEVASVAPPAGETGPPEADAGAMQDGASTDAGEVRRRVARGLSLARVAVGAAYLAVPSLAGPTWIGRAGSLGGARIVAAGLGARDVALGLGTLTTMDDDAAARRWLRAQFASDLADFLATLAHGRDVETGPRLSGLVMTGAATALAGFAAFGPAEG